MRKPFRFKKQKLKSGLPPGTLVHTGEQKIDKPQITILDYSPDHITKAVTEHPKECVPYKDKESVTWINIDGLHEIEILEYLGTEYDLHPLVLEDIVSTSQRSKVEYYKDYIYIVIRMLTFQEKHNEIHDEQFSIVLGKDFVISFQEKPGDVFDPIRDRLQNGKGRLRNMGADYLSYALIDAIVDHYFVILEQIGEKIVFIEEQLMNEPDDEVMEEIHSWKREMIFLRKAIWPLREVIAQINREESTLFTSKTQVFLRDVYDHTIQVVDTIESYRDILSGLLDLYLSILSNRMNEVMKVLTIIATIFIPLTFIAGVYGMNFEFMPELKWHWAYPAVWIVMLSLAVVMLFFFKKRKWI